MRLNKYLALVKDMNYEQKALKAHKLFMFFIKKRQYFYADRALKIQLRFFEASERLSCSWLYD